MKAIAVFLSISFLAMVSIAQESTKNSGEEIVTGYCERSDLETGDFGQYFEKQHHDYKPDQQICEQLKEYKGDLRISIVMATWCSDSREQVPGFFRILDDINMNSYVQEMICVDREKKAGEINLDTYNIEKVPTFIFYVNDKEAGRIIETPQKTLEEDFLDILKSTGEFK